MSAFTLNREQNGFAQINVTPLVDVMLVLLIIFMLATPMLTQRITLNFAHCETGCPKASDPVNLSIKQTGEFYWNGVSVNGAELGQNLSVLAQQIDPPMLTLHAEPRTRYELVASVLTMAKNANLQRISMEPASR